MRQHVGQFLRQLLDTGVVVSKHTLCLIALFTSIATVASSTGAAGAETWTYELLGSIDADGGAYFEANAINDSGLIAGGGYDPKAKRDVAWRWKDGVFTKSSPIVREAAGYAINGSGEVLGKWLSSNADYTNAMLWQFNAFGAVMSGLRRLTKDAVAVGSDINDGGVAVGWECVPFGNGLCKQQALLWTPTWPPPLYLSTVTGLGHVWGESSAHALNNAGDILGHTRDAFDINRAWVMPQGGEILLLPVPDNFDDTFPGDINAGGVVVGALKSGTQPCQYVQWLSASTPPVDLGVSGNRICPLWPSFRASIRVSDAGRIAMYTGGSTAYTLMGATLTQLPVPANAASLRVGGINTCGTIVGTVIYSHSVAGAEVIRWRRLEANVPVCD